MKRIVLLSAFFITVASSSLAQITPVGTLPAWLMVVRSLPSAGVKLFSTSSNGVVLYNLDLTVYTTITYPALPPGYSYFDVVSFTENTFDTDPMSIELMMLTMSGNGVSGTRVLRDDGTILLSELGHAPSAQAGIGEPYAKPAVFEGDNGIAYLVLTSYPTNPPTESKVFQLPGVVPCIDCAGGGNMTVGEGDRNATGSLTLFPNPSASNVTVNYSLPVDATAPRLLVQDAGGRLIRNVALNGSGNSTLELGGLSPGTYSVTLVADGQVLATQLLTVGR